MAAALIAFALAILFKHQNVAVLVSIAFGLAASASFPVLILAIYWRGGTARGVVAGGIAGLVSSMPLEIAGPTIWQQVLGHERPLFPSDYPTLLTMPLAFLIAVIVSRRQRAVTRIRREYRLRG